MKKNLSFETSKTIRLDLFLREELPKSFSGEYEFSNSKIRRLILAGCVLVNGKNCLRPAFELRGFSKVNVFFDSEKFFFEKSANDISFEVTKDSVLYEDEYLIFINKPAFFPVEETIVGNEKRDNLHSAVIRYLQKKNPNLRNPPYVGIMHRLDKETSGVIVFTKKREANKAIQEQFVQHSIKKIYECVCTKEKSCKKQLLEGESFSCEFFMNRISSKSQKAKWGKTEEKSGFYSKTIFTVIKNIQKNSKHYVHLNAELFTGRTHQIRVHASESGFPLLGDTLYGGQKHNRISLHAKLLELLHPVTKETLTITAPVPESIFP